MIIYNIILYYNNVLNWKNKMRMLNGFANDFLKFQLTLRADVRIPDCHFSKI